MRPRRAICEVSKLAEHSIWITDDVLRDAFTRFARSHSHVHRRAIGNLPGPLEHYKRIAQKRHSSATINGNSHSFTPSNIEVATFKWLKRLWDPKCAAQIEWQPPIPLAKSEMAPSRSQESRSLVARTPTLVESMPHHFSPEAYLERLDSVKSLDGLRKLHWEVGASDLDARVCSRLALQHLISLGTSKDDLIEFWTDPTVNSCRGSDIVPLAKHDAHGTWNSSEVKRLLQFRIPFCTTRDLIREFCALTDRSGPKLYDIGAIQLDLHFAQSAINELLQTTTHVECKSRVESVLRFYNQKVLPRRFRRTSPSPEKFAFLDTLAVASEDESHLASLHDLIAEQSFNQQLAHLGIDDVLDLPHNVRCVVLPTFVGQVLKLGDNSGDGAVANWMHVARLWEECFQHRDLHSVGMCITRLVSAAMKPEDLGPLFKELRNDSAIAFAYQAWWEPAIIKHAVASNSIKVRFIRNIPQAAWNILVAAKSPAVQARKRLSELGQRQVCPDTSELPELKPIIHATKSLAAFVGLDAATLKVSELVLHSLLDRKLYSAFAWYGGMIKKHFQILLPRGVIVSFVREASRTHPDEAIDGFFLNERIQLTRVPNLMLNLVESKHNSMHPDRLLSPLRRLGRGRHRERVGYNHGMAYSKMYCWLAWEELNMLHELAWSVAISQRYSAAARLQMLWKIWRYLRRFKAPVDWRFSQAAMVAAVYNYHIAGKHISTDQMLFVLRITRIVDGNAVANEVDKALWMPVDGFLPSYVDILQGAGRPTERIASYEQQQQQQQQQAPAAQETLD